jgi:hypothetical protein
VAPVGRVCLLCKVLKFLPGQHARSIMATSHASNRICTS